MPTGQKMIVWDDANDAKLLRAILATHTIKMDFKAVGDIFGLPGSCISGHLNKMRGSVNALRLNGGGTPQKKSAANGITTKTPTKGKPKASAKRKSSEDDEHDDDSEVDVKPIKSESAGESDATVGKSPKKPRLSPRKVDKRNYKSLANPKVEEGTDGEDGAENETSSDEGSYPSDPDFRLTEAV